MQCLLLSHVLNAYTYFRYHLAFDTTYFRSFAISALVPAWGDCLCEIWCNMIFTATTLYIKDGSC